MHLFSTWAELSNCSMVGNRSTRVLYTSLETCFAARIALYRKTSYSGVIKGFSFSCVQDRRCRSAGIDNRPNSIVFNGVTDTFSINKLRRILYSDNGIVSTTLDNKSGETFSGSL